MGLFAKIGHAIVLPQEVTDFEDSYLRRANRIALGFFALHVPVFMVIAFFNDTNPLLALVLTLATMVGPAAAYRSLKNPRHMSVVFGFTSMLMGGLLVHFGQGPVQIEMHFYFFALLAMLAVFGNPVVILTAAVTVALHHLILWMVLPSSVFNYDAPIWVVLVHAAFVVLESIATCYIARSFFDNVIGLEKIVRARTAELDSRNQDMRMVLDNVDQGFLTFDRECKMASEHSAVLDGWFGEPVEGQSVAEYIGTVCSSFVDDFALAWSQVEDGFLPLELTMAQMPDTFSAAGREYEVQYRPIMDGEDLQRVLMVITDVTAERERQRLEVEQHETLRILDRIVSDKAGFLEFMAEGSELVDAICTGKLTNVAVIKRAVHTLKGNTMIFGVQTVADLCHELEGVIENENKSPSTEQTKALADRWERLQSSLRRVLGDDGKTRLEIEQEQFDELLSAALAKKPHEAIAEMVANLRLEPTSARLRRVGEQAQRIAKRLGKGNVRIEVDDQALRLEPGRWNSFWSSFIHVVRNAVDHGVERSDARRAAGKKEEPCVTLRTYIDGPEFVISLHDDGAGIDWESVAARAKRLGLPSEGQAELAEALFVDGLSTRDEVTELSGRGVGLGAARAACIERGGRVAVHSSPGKGTRFEFRFPAASMRPPAADLFIAAA